MSESEHIAAAPPKDSGLDSPPIPVMDEEDRLRPGFVGKVLDAVASGDDETARELVAPLHPADVADLIELARRDDWRIVATATADGALRDVGEIADDVWELVR